MSGDRNDRHVPNDRNVPNDRDVELLSRVARSWADGTGGGAGGDRSLSADATADATADARGWLALEDALGRQRRRQAWWRPAGEAGGSRLRRPTVLLGGGGLVAAGVLAVVVAMGVGRQPRLSFVLEGGIVQPGGRVAPAVEAAPARLSFSDGTEVVLQPGARGAVVGTSRQGARLRLDVGRARFAVAHLPKAEWSVDAGPFTVIVHGTVFDLDWTAAALTVDLMAGKVTVKGPLPGGAVTLEPGQRLVARPTKGEMRVDRTPAASGAPPGPSASASATTPATAATTETDETMVAAPGAAVAIDADADADDTDGEGGGGAVAGGAPPVHSARGARSGGRAGRGSSERRLAALGRDEASGARTAAAAAAGDPAAGRARSSLSLSPPPVSPSSSPLAAAAAGWTARVAAGEFSAVVTAAQQLGIDRCLAELPADALTALADAARYVRRADLARRVLLAQRRRFPGTSAAHDAAFLIGRLSEDAAHDRREALSWYDRYLEEGDRGTYASEALGRKMFALDALGDDQAAAAAAERYLAEFPDAAYAPQARRLRGQ